MSNVIDNIKKRRSIRRFLPKKVSRKVILQIIEAGRYAPSSHNSQPWRFIVIEDKQVILELSERVKSWFRHRLLLGKFVGVFNRRIKQEVDSAKKRLISQDLFFYDAPLLILVCAKPSRFAEKDCSLAAQNMMLAARSLNVGSCWIGFADLVVNKDRSLMNKVGVPHNCRIMAHLVFGYPNGFPSSAYPRKKEADIIKWIK